MTETSSRLRPRRVGRALSPDCRRSRDPLSAFVDGEVGSEDAEWVRAHIDGCDRCGNAERGLRLLLAALRGGAEIPVLAPRRLRLRVEQQFAETRER